MKKKILCLLLALLMVFGATTSVFADVAIVATQISSVSVNIGVPVVGEKPDMEPKFSSDTVGCEFITAGENYAVMWYNVTDEKDMSANDVFEEDKIYEAYFLIGALDYYQFKKYSEMTAFVNGTEVENTAICGIHGMSETNYACIVIEMASVKKHNIEITNGYAKNSDGEVITSAIPNEIVTIVAEDTTGIRSFNWWRYYGYKVEFADDEAETTTFVMPDYSVVIEAFFSDVLVEEAKFTVAGYYIGESVESVVAFAPEGIKILPIDGYATNCVLFPDNNGRPDEIAVTGAIQANEYYWVGIRFAAEEGYDICELMPENVVLDGALDSIFSSNGDYDNLEATVFFKLPYASNKPVITDNAVTITIETIAPSFTDMGDITVVFVSVEDPSVTYSFKTTLKTTLDDGKTTLDDGKTTLDDGKTTLDDGKTTLDDGKTTLDDGKTTLDDGKTTLDDGKTTLDEGKTTLGEGKTTLDFYLKTTDGFLKTTDIPEGEYIIKTTKPGFVAQDFKTTLKTTGPANLKTTLHVYGDTDGSGEIDSMDYVLLKRAYFGTYKLKLEFVGDTNGSGEIDSMDYVLLKRAYFGTFKTTSFGKTTLDDGKTTLDDGKTTLDDGKTTLDDGKTTLDDGKTTLDTGKTTLDVGKTTL